MPDKFEAPARLLLLWEGRRTAGDCKDAKGGMGGGRGSALWGKVRVGATKYPVRRHLILAD